MPISVNLDKGLDRAYEDKNLDEILAAPPSALAGLTENHDKLLADSASRPSAIWAATSTSHSPGRSWPCRRRPAKALS